MKLYKKLKIFKKLIIKYLILMSKQTKKPMSKQSAPTHKVKYTTLEAEKFSFNEIQLKKPGSLRLWNVNYSKNDEEGTLRLQLPSVKLEWRGRTLAPSDSKDPNCMLLPLDEDVKEVATYKKKLKSVDSFLEKEAKKILGKDYKKYTYKSMVTQSGDEDDRPDFMKLKYQLDRSTGNLIARVYEKTDDVPMLHREDVNSMETLREFLPFNSELLLMIEPSVVWAQTKKDDNGKQQWGLSWRVVFARRNTEGDDKPRNSGSTTSVLSLEDFDLDNVTLTEKDTNLNTDKQDIHYVRMSGDKFYLDLPPVTINHHGKPLIKDDNDNIVEPTYFKMPLYESEHEELMEKLDGLDEKIKGYFKQDHVFGKNHKKYFMQPTVRRPDEDDDDNKSDRPPFMKINFRTQYGTDTLTTQVFDCTEDPDGDSSTWKNMNCSSISEFWESVKYRDTIQARVQIHKFYAMRSKAGGEKKRAGLGFKFVHVRKLAEGASTMTRTADTGNDNFLDDDEDVESLDGQLDNGLNSDDDDVEVSEDVSEDGSDDDVSDDVSDDISEDESEEEVKPKKSTKAAAKARVKKTTKKGGKSRSKKV